MIWQQVADGQLDRPNTIHSDSNTQTDILYSVLPNDAFVCACIHTCVCADVCMRECVCVCASACVVLMSDVGFAERNS